MCVTSTVVPWLQLRLKPGLRRMEVQLPRKLQRSPEPSHPPSNLAQLGQSCLASAQTPVHGLGIKWGRALGYKWPGKTH